MYHYQPRYSNSILGYSSNEVISDAGSGSQEPMAHNLFKDNRIYINQKLAATQPFISPSLELLYAMQLRLTKHAPVWNCAKLYTQLVGSWTKTLDQTNRVYLTVLPLTTLLSRYNHATTTAIGRAKRLHSHTNCLTPHTIGYCWGFFQTPD